jgi:hypothetical protein
MGPRREIEGEENGTQGKSLMRGGVSNLLRVGRRCFVEKKSRGVRSDSIATWREGGAGPGDNRWQGGTNPQAAERLRQGISNGIGGANMWASGYSAPV